MHQATITVSYVNQPRTATGKKGSIKDREGRYFGVWKDRLSQFEAGKTYDVEYTIDQWQGKDQYNIKRAKLRGAALPPPPAGHNSNGNGQSNPSRDKQISVLALVKPWIEKIPVGDAEAMTTAIMAAMTAYDRTLGAAAHEEIPQ